MIHPELRFEGFDARSWTNLISLFAPDVVWADRASPISGDVDEEADELTPKDRTRGALIIVIDDRDRVLTAFHTSRGRVEGLTWTGPDALPMLAARYRARRCIALREGVIEEITERVARRHDRDADYFAQCLLIMRTVRELSEAGLLHTWPRPLANVPIPTSAMVRRALDTVLPEDRTLALVVWNGSTPWTGLVLRRRKGGIDLVAGPDLIARWAGPLGGDWRRDHRVISDAITDAVAPVHLGIFTELDTLRALLRSADPGAWARAALVRDVIVHPTPPYVAVALGADAVRAVARGSARWLGGIDALSALAPLATYVRGRVAEVASVTATLGFDPLKVLAIWLRRGEDEPEPTLPRPQEDAP